MSRGIPLNLAREQMVLSGLQANPQPTHFFFLDTDVLFESPPNVNDAIYMLLATIPPSHVVYIEQNKRTGSITRLDGGKGPSDGKLNFRPVEPPPSPKNWSP